MSKEAIQAALMAVPYQTEVEPLPSGEGWVVQSTFHTARLMGVEPMYEARWLAKGVSVDGFRAVAVEPGFVEFRPTDSIPRRRKVLDHGLIRIVETWGGGDHGGDHGGNEAGIIEAARQSTQGNFRGWERDRRLLRYLYENKHSTPFEFAGAIIEVRAPIFIFRQWHRHRTQSYNEFSGRYTELPDLWYVPTVERLLARDAENKQAGSKGGKELTEMGAIAFQESLEASCSLFRDDYKDALDMGVPKELARLHMPLNWYSQMRASANLRNWLGFLTLRQDPHAQWEIRQYADALNSLLIVEFPEVMALFNDGVAQ